MNKKTQNQDPFAAREAEKYSNPVPSREFILARLQEKDTPLDLKEVCQEFLIDSEEGIEAIRRRLIAMTRDGQLEQGLKRKYFPARAKILINGTLHFDRRGALWCIPEMGGPRIAVASFNKDISLHGSKVILAVPEDTANTEARGRIVEVVQKSTLRVIGRFIQDNKLNYVIPHGKEIVEDIIIPAGKHKNAQDGDIVLVEIINQQSTWSDLVGQVSEVIGHENSKGIEVSAAIHAHNLSHQWPKEIAQELQDFSKKSFAITSKNRVDLRDLPLVTIDGEDAKDFDDAVYCQAKKGGGWKLFVAIADVSYYVHANTVLDAEAKLRGNSVYFPGKVVPMLPETLSNDLCSLLPQTDRMCMVCELNINAAGIVTSYSFYEGIIHSHARLTYTKVAKILSGESKHLQDTYADLVDDLHNLHALYNMLHKQRKARGALDFDSAETRIIFDEHGKIKQIEPVTRNVAHKIIEECMLCANVAAAEFLEKHKLPAMYRIHEGPTVDKLADLKAFLLELGINFGKKKQPEPLDYAQLISKIQTRTDAHIIQMLLLRSLSQAVYSTENLGHFGLAYPAYTHFTSPIRRYPDLIVHRQIKQVLHSKWKIAKTKKEQEAVAKQAEKMQELAVHCSVTERRADDATRDVELWLKCQYIAKFIGQNFTGVVSGVNRFGFFVELAELHVDGLVHVTALKDDFYIYNQAKHQLLGERTHRGFSLGQQVNVIVAKVNIAERKIDFELVPDKNSPKAAPQKKSKRTGPSKNSGKREAKPKPQAARNRQGRGNNLRKQKSAGTKKKS